MVKNRLEILLRKCSVFKHFSFKTLGKLAEKIRLLCLSEFVKGIRNSIFSIFKSANCITIF